MQKFLIGLMVLAGAFSLSACDKEKSASSAGAATTLKIAVIPKGTTHAYWKSVQAGANQAGKDLGVEILWKGPLEENDRSQQIDIVRQFVGDQVSAIVLAPLDNTALAKPVKEAKAAKIPVAIIDSGLEGTPGDDYASFIATDNRHAGELGGEQLAKLLGGKGKVVLLRYQTGSASTDEREAGFLDVMHKNPGITMLVDNRFGGATKDSAQSAATEMIDQINDADGLFCPNESTTAGMLQAIKNARSDKPRKFVGFDATPELIDAMKAGSIDALVAQNPYKMGYEGVKTAVAAAKGQPVTTHIDTGVRVITAADLSDPDTQKFLAQ